MSVKPEDLEDCFILLAQVREFLHQRTTVPGESHQFMGKLFCTLQTVHNAADALSNLLTEERKGS